MAVISIRTIRKSDYPECPHCPDFTLGEKQLIVSSCLLAEQKLGESSECLQAVTVRLSFYQGRLVVYLKVVVSDPPMSSRGLGQWKNAGQGKTEDEFTITSEDLSESSIVLTISGFVKRSLARRITDLDKVRDHLKTALDRSFPDPSH